MGNFWDSRSGAQINGAPENAFISDFSVIPEGTRTVAVIKGAKIEIKEPSKYSDGDKFINITYKILEGDFKGRDVNQKIKVFYGEPASIDRNLNMLMRLFRLCNAKPTHSNEPSNSDLLPLYDNIIGIVIGEWSFTTPDGKFLEGNFIREIHSSEDFEVFTGVKKETKRENIKDRNVDASDAQNFDDDIPFI